MNHLTYAEAQKLAQSGKKIIFIDVRTPGEHHLEHIRDSINLPLDTFDAKSYRKQLEKYDVVIAYCNTGNVSSQFIKRAAQAGINNVSNMTGGISVCKDCPIEKEK